MDLEKEQKDILVKLLEKSIAAKLWILKNKKPKSTYALKAALRKEQILLNQIEGKENGEQEEDEYFTG